MTRILVVEDDPELLLGLKDNLELEGYEVSTAMDGPSGLHQALDLRPDGIILDVMLPGLTGFEVCRHLRHRGVRAPILMLTARAQDSDKVLGLELGADDYVTKPFSLIELLARIRAMLRRSGGAPATPDWYRYADVEIDFRRQQAWKGDHEVSMSALEFAVMQYLIANRGDAISRERLLNDVWGYKTMLTTRSVDNLVARLRQKLETEPHAPRHLITVHGTGYRFVD